jgi:hypothetical protein
LESQGYVYILYNPTNCLVKIGKTKFPYKRFSALSNQNGSKFKYYISDAMFIEGIVEKVMHNKFSFKRRSGEWFDISYDDAVYELEKLLNSKDFNRRNVDKT